MRLLITQHAGLRRCRTLWPDNGCGYWPTFALSSQRVFATPPRQPFLISSKVVYLAIMATDFAATNTTPFYSRQCNPSHVTLVANSCAPGY